VMPRFSAATNAAQAASIAASLKTLANALQRYKTDNGTWPTDTMNGVMPPQLADYLVEFDFGNAPGGGEWDWDHWPSDLEYIASMSVMNLSVAQMQAVDDLIDDGDLSTGVLRSGRGRMLFILEFA